MVFKQHGLNPTWHSQKYERLIITSLVDDKTADFDTVNNYKLRIDFNGNVAKKKESGKKRVEHDIKKIDEKDIPKVSKKDLEDQIKNIETQLDKNTLPATGFNQGPSNLV